MWCWSRAELVLELDGVGELVLELDGAGAMLGGDERRRAGRR